MFECGALQSASAFFVFERCAPREMGTPRWVGAPRCTLQEGRLFEKGKNETVKLKICYGV